MTIVAGRKYRFTVSQLAPSAYPAPARAKVHGRHPATV